MKKLSCFLVAFLLTCTLVFVPSNTASALKGVDSYLDTPVWGMDVSAWRGYIDWNMARDAGIRFAMLRSGYSDGTTKDESDGRFFEYVKGANDAGVPIGVFHFSYAASPEEARREAEYCVSLIERSEGRFDYPIVFDFEEDPLAGEKWSILRRTGGNKQLMIDIVEAFCSTIENRGYYASFYVNRNWLDTYLSGRTRDGKLLTEKYDLWLAQWDVGSKPRDCGIWQYTSTGNVAGVNPPVDLDYAYYNYPARIRKAGCNHLG